jgi:hypothetical protein
VTPAELDGGVGGTSCKTKGGHSRKIASRGEDGSDGNNSAPVGAKKPTLLRTLAAATIRSKVSTRRGDGGTGIYPDNGVAAAARFAPGAKGRMPNDGLGAALESITGAEVMRRALAALRDNIYEEAEQEDNNKEEPSGDSNNDGFVITQGNNTKDDETSDGEAPKVQQASGRKAHQQTHKEARHLADRGGGMLGLASDGKDGKTRNPKAGSGRRAINKDRNARALEARQGSWASDASKSHQRTEEVAHPPAYWDSGLHRRASEGEDENNWSPAATQVGDTVAWVQAWEAAYAQNKPNPAAHQGSGTRAPPGRTALPGSAALVGPAMSGKNKGKTGQSASAANFFISPGTPAQRRGRYSPWGPRGEPQPPSGRGVVRQKPGDNRSGRKRCWFCTGPGTL